MKLFISGMPPKLALAPFQALAIDSEKEPGRGQFLQPMLPKSNRLLGWLMVISLFFAFSRVAAQSLRDPTLPPPEAALAGSGSARTSLGIESGAMTIIVRNDRPHLVIGTQLYAQGAKIGQVRIERITETEIWLREGGVLRKVSQFPGIQRRTVTPLAAKPLCASSPSKPSSPAAPCVKVQP